MTAPTDADDLKGQSPGNYVYDAIGRLVENVGEGLKYYYNTAGLVAEVKKNNLTLVRFTYNDRGHRVGKEIYTGGSLTRSDRYVRDASGSVLAVYEGAVLKEQTIFGLSRLGVYYKASGASAYQLADHLGNVRAVILKDGANALAVTNRTDYYPFGMAMPGRNVEGDFRYGFQGQEKDGETGMEAFQLRLWDSRIGRWLTTDPYGQYSSPYVGMGNDPINGIDPDGGWKTKWGRFWGWVGNGFKGKFIGNGNANDPTKNYGLQLAETTSFSEINGGFQQEITLNSLYSGADLVAFNNGFADPVMAPQTTFEKIFGDNLRAGPNGFAVDKYGYELDFYPPQTGMGALGLIGGGPSSYKLGKNLIKSGISRPANSAAHHIVAGTDRRAALARKLLAAENIGINSAKNGVFLPKSSKYIKVKDAIPHSIIHTNLYYKELTRKLQSAGSGNVGKALEQFKQSIINGTVKY